MEPEQINAFATVATTGLTRKASAGNMAHQQNSVNTRDVLTRHKSKGCVDVMVQLQRSVNIENVGIMLQSKVFVDNMEPLQNSAGTPDVYTTPKNKEHVGNILQI